MKNLKKDLLSFQNWNADQLERLFQLAKQLKAKKKLGNLLKGKVLGMIFEKPSARTRVSFSVAMFQLGGQSLELSGESLGLGTRESIPDVARTLSRYLDALVIRTYGHSIAVELAQYSTLPVINGLTDSFHPCQALADGLTLLEHGPGFKKTHLVYIGDGNNVLHSLLELASKTGLRLTYSTPAKFKPDSEIARNAQKLNARIVWESDPKQAVRSADFIYTDVWASMGKEKGFRSKKPLFLPYQINEKLMSHAPRQAKVMHCLPAHRGNEITDEIIDSDQSIVFDQAENRLHIQKALLLTLLES